MIRRFLVLLVCVVLVLAFSPALVLAQGPSDTWVPVSPWAEVCESDLLGQVPFVGFAWLPPIPDGSSPYKVQDWFFQEDVTQGCAWNMIPGFGSDLDPSGNLYRPPISYFQDVAGDNVTAARFGFYGRSISGPADLNLELSYADEGFVVTTIFDTVSLTSDWQRFEFTKTNLDIFGSSTKRFRAFYVTFDLSGLVDDVEVDKIDVAAFAAAVSTPTPTPTPTATATSTSTPSAFPCVDIASPPNAGGIIDFNFSVSPYNSDWQAGSAAEFTDNNAIGWDTANCTPTSGPMATHDGTGWKSILCAGEAKGAVVNSFNLSSPTTGTNTFIRAFRSYSASFGNEWADLECVNPGPSVTLLVGHPAPLDSGWIALPMGFTCEKLVFTNLSGASGYYARVDKFQITCGVGTYVTPTPTATPTATPTITCLSPTATPGAGTATITPTATVGAGTSTPAPIPTCAPTSTPTATITPTSTITPLLSTPTAPAGTATPTATPAPPPGGTIPAPGGGTPGVPPEIPTPVVVFPTVVFDDPFGDVINPCIAPASSTFLLADWQCGAYSFPAWPGFTILIWVYFSYLVQMVQALWGASVCFAASVFSWFVFLLNLILVAFFIIAHFFCSVAEFFRLLGVFLGRLWTIISMFAGATLTIGAAPTTFLGMSVTPVLSAIAAILSNVYVGAIASLVFGLLTFAMWRRIVSNLSGGSGDE